jgi:hypothetical protein
MPLWNVCQFIPDIPFCSTVTSKTIAMKGFHVPNPTNMSPGQLYEPDECKPVS